MIKKALKRYELIIYLIYVYIACCLFYYDTTFDSYDGVIQYLSGKNMLKEGRYNGYSSKFWPPLYSTILSFGNKVISSFTIGKLTSIVSILICLIVSYTFTLIITKKKIIGILSQLLLISNPFILDKITDAENNVLDSSLYLLSLLLLYKIYLNKEKRILYFFLGLTIGLSMLTRYTSYQLAIIYIVYIMLNYKKTKRLNIIIPFLIIILINGPWWVDNIIQNGSPIYTWQYLNIGARIGNHDDKIWWWETQKNIFNLRDVISHYGLKGYSQNIIYNLYNSFYVLYQVLGLLIIPSICSFIYLIYKKNSFKILFLIFTSYLLLVSNAFIFPDLLLTWVIIFLISLSITLNEILNQKKTFVILSLIIVVISYQFNSNFKRKIYNLKKYSKKITLPTNIKNKLKNKYIMSVNPKYAYYFNSYYCMLPLYNKNKNVKLNTLIKYEGYDSKIKDYAPKYPSKEPLNCQYIIIDNDFIKFYPKYKPLLDMKNPNAQNFETLYHSKNQNFIILKK